MEEFFDLLAVELNKLNECDPVARSTRYFLHSRWKTIVNNERS